MFCTFVIIAASMLYVSRWPYLSVYEARCECETRCDEETSEESSSLPATTRPLPRSPSTSRFLYPPWRDSHPWVKVPLVLWLVSRCLCPLTRGLFQSERSTHRLRDLIKGQRRCCWLMFKPGVLSCANSGMSGSPVFRFCSEWYDFSSTVVPTWGRPPRPVLRKQSRDGRRPPFGGSAGPSAGEKGQSSQSDVEGVRR